MPEAPLLFMKPNMQEKAAQKRLPLFEKELKKCNAKALFLSALDEIAWTLNLRGNDVHCNPVLVSYLLIEENETHYFIQPQKITAEVATYMKETGVNLHTYEEAEAYLSRISVESLLLNPAKTNQLCIQQST